METAGIIIPTYSNRYPKIRFIRAGFKEDVEILQNIMA
jgi:hypothetical protein